MSKGILIAGTGTDVGKTMLTTGLLRLCLHRGRDVMVMKPVQTGALFVVAASAATDVAEAQNAVGDVPDTSNASPVSEGLNPTASSRRSRPWIQIHGRGGVHESVAAGAATTNDIDIAQAASGLIISPDDAAHVRPYSFQPTCSPHLAARMAGVTIEIDRIVEHARALQARHDLLIVETAGGIMVPLNETQTTLDLAAALNMPIILVGHSGLGTINHVLLSLMAMRSRNLNILGVVLNDPRPPALADQYIRDDNVRAIETFGQVHVIARIPYLSDAANLVLLDKALAPLESVLDELR